MSSRPKTAEHMRPARPMHPRILQKSPLQTTLQGPLRTLIMFRSSVPKALSSVTVEATVFVVAYTSPRRIPLSTCTPWFRRLEVPPTGIPEASLWGLCSRHYSIPKFVLLKLRTTFPLTLSLYTVRMLLLEPQV